jgi:hypothetical protein
MVFIPVVEASVPVTETGRSSARRKPVWMFVLEGAKIDLSLGGVSGGRGRERERYLIVTSTALVPLASN